MYNLFKIIGVVVVALLIIGIILLIDGLVVMLLWNWIMPHLFSLPEITLAMAIGMSILLGFLFGAIKIKLGK